MLLDLAQVDQEQTERPCRNLTVRVLTPPLHVWVYLSANSITRRAGDICRASHCQPGFYLYISGMPNTGIAAQPGLRQALPTAQLIGVGSR